GAQEMVRGLLVQPHRAAYVRADPGVGDDVVDRPVHRADQRAAVVRRRDPQLARPELDQGDGGLGQSIWIFGVALGHDRDRAAGRAEVGRGERGVFGVDEQPTARAPYRVPQAGARQRAQVAEHHQRNGGQGQRGEHQRAPYQWPLDELARLRALFEVFLEGGALGVSRAQVVPLLDYLRVRHYLPHPDQRAEAEGEQRDGQREAQRQVGAEDLVHRVDFEADVGGDETTARDEREREGSRDEL